MDADMSALLGLAAAAAPEIVIDEVRAAAGEIADMVECERVCDLLDGYYSNSAPNLVEPACVVTKWGVEWLKHVWHEMVGGHSVKQLAKKIVKEFDEVGDNPEHFVEEHTITREKSVRDRETGQVEVQKVSVTTLKLKKGKRSKFAVAIANLAYNKFGQRAFTEANVMVTRRWIQKWLDQEKFADLRLVDKNNAIDRALFLSFLPTDSFRLMQLVKSTKQWEERTDPEGVLKRGLFGRVFRLVRHDVSDLEEA